MGALSKTLKKLIEMLRTWQRIKKILEYKF